jgi:hypothetical protein
VNQLTPEEVHNGNQEFASRKAKPINKSRFEANHGGVVYRVGVHLRDMEFQPAAQPTGAMIREAICLGDRRLLPVVGH